MEINIRKAIFFNILLGLVVFILLVGVLEIGLRMIGRTNDNFLKQDPVLGWTHLANKDGWSVTGEYRVPVHLNNFGLVGSDTTLEKPAGTFRIAFVGDSLTEAFQINPEAAFPRVVEERLKSWTGVTFEGVEVCGLHGLVEYNSKNTQPKSTDRNECHISRWEIQTSGKSNSSPTPNLEVLNFGVTSYGTVKEDWVIRSQVLKFNPDLVVLGFFVGNDFADNLNERINSEANFSSWQKLKNKPKLRFRNHSVAYRWFLEKRARLNFATWFQSKKEVGSLGAGSFVVNPEEMAKTKEYLLKIKDFTEEHHISLLVLILPSKEQVHGQLRSSGDSSSDLKEPNKVLKEFFDQEKIAYLDTLPNFQSWAKMNPESLAFFKFDGHPNETGHFLIARTLIDYLTK